MHEQLVAMNKFAAASGGCSNVLHGRRCKPPVRKEITYTMSVDVVRAVVAGGGKGKATGGGRDDRSPACRTNASKFYSKFYSRGRRAQDYSQWAGRSRSAHPSAEDTAIARAKAAAAADPLAGEKCHCFFCGVGPAIASQIGATGIGEGRLWCSACRGQLRLQASFIQQQHWQRRPAVIHGVCKGEDASGCTNCTVVATE